MRECEEGESERKEEETEGKRGGGREGKTERERKVECSNTCFEETGMLRGRGEHVCK